MAKYHILFGLDDADIVRTIVNAIKKQRHEVEFATAITKEEIRDYLQRHKTVTTLILREVMGTESFTAEELAQLNDVNNYNIIVVVDASHRGQPFMQVLYSAGITSAILLGEKSGAAPATIADLVLNQRSRKKARDYYGMSNVSIKVDLLTSDIFTEKFAMLTNEEFGFNLIDRFVQVVRRLTVKQAVDFTAKLPPNIKRELMEYEEYYKVLEYFKRNGYKVTSGKKPKNLKKGLSDEVFLAALSLKKKGTPKKVEQTRSVPMQRNISKPVVRQDAVGVAHSSVENNSGSSVSANALPTDSNAEMSMASMLGVDQDVITTDSQLLPSEHMDERTFRKNEEAAETAVAIPPEVETKTSLGTVEKKTVIKASPKAGSVKVVSTSSAFNKGKKKRTKTRSKKRISWKPLLILLAFGIICLILWYFSLSLIRIL